MSLKWRELKLRKRVEEFRDLWDKRMGLLCFSADWTNPVQWSHYADKHRGICLGFDVPRDDAEQVIYSLERIDDLAIDFDELQVRIRRRCG